MVTGKQKGGNGEYGTGQYLIHTPTEVVYKQRFGPKVAKEITEYVTVVQAVCAKSSLHRS